MSNESIHYVENSIKAVNSQVVITTETTICIDRWFKIHAKAIVS
jgi:hypothetical protein